VVDEQLPIPVASSDTIPGREIDRTVGLCWGIYVRSVGFSKGVTGAFRSLKAGEVPQYTDAVEQARKAVLERLVQHAQELGGDAVVAVRFDSSDIAENVAELVAYGTAVVLR
jgi:uncharacterized protein YbjQ (UPF0145 family)